EEYNQDEYLPYAIGNEPVPTPVRDFEGQDYSLSDYTQDALGLDEGVTDRWEFLPIATDENGETVAAVPNALVAAGEAALWPYYLMRGGEYTHEDALNFFLTFGTGLVGGLAAKATKKPIKDAYGHVSNKVFGRADGTAVSHPDSVARSKLLGLNEFPSDSAPAKEGLLFVGPNGESVTSNVAYLIGKHPNGKYYHLPKEVYEELFQKYFDLKVDYVARSSKQLKGDYGRIRISPDTNQPRSVAIDKSLKKDEQLKALAHELGHAIDELSQQISTKGIIKELNQIYSFGAEGKFRERKLYTPSAAGYNEKETPRELMAEAIRQYLIAPDLMNEKFPATAKRIRDAVNNRSELSNIIQLNSTAAIGLGLMSYDEEDFPPMGP
ncbi:MAG: hypothetical protein ACPGOY_18710, partial [Rhodospirillaceae bacterium]